MGNSQISETAVSTGKPESKVSIDKAIESKIVKVKKADENYSTPSKCPLVLESRSPTSRFVHKRKNSSDIFSPCHRLHRSAKKLELESPDASEASEAENEDSDVVEDTNEVSICSTSSLTASAIKRKRKREKKKAKQAQKEDLIKKQKAQRAEELRNYEEKRASNRRAMALYASAVAKPILPRDSQLCACCPAPSADSSESSKDCSNKSTLIPQEREEFLNSLNSTGPPCCTPCYYSDSAPPSPAFTFPEKEAEPVTVQNREQSPIRIDTSPKLTPGTPKKMLLLFKTNKCEEGFVETEEKEDKQPEEGNSDCSVEEFEVLVQGERRRVREFHPNRYGSESSETTSARSDIKEPENAQSPVLRRPDACNDPPPSYYVRNGPPSQHVHPPPRIYSYIPIRPPPPHPHPSHSPHPLPSHPHPPQPHRPSFQRAHPPYQYVQMGPPPGLPMPMMMNRSVYFSAPPRMMQPVYPMMPLPTPPPPQPAPLRSLRQPKITLEIKAAPQASDEELEHIVAGVTSIFDNTGDDPPPPPSPMKMETINVAQKKVIEQVIEHMTRKASFERNIWKYDDLGHKVLEHNTLEHKQELTKVQSNPEPKLEPKEGPEKDLTVVTICKRMEPYFRNTRVYWYGKRVDNTMLRDMFHEAHNREMPPAHWKILEKVCSFQPGYFHVFHEIIGASIEFTYSYEQRPGEQEEEEHDELFTLYKALPSADGVEKFFSRFEERYLQQVVQYMSDRFIPIRVFVAILDVIFPPDHSLALTTSDLYYLATLVFGARQFYERFTVKFSELQIAESAGKRWIRKSCESRMPMFKSDGQLMDGGRVKDVADFINRLRPHIDDVLQLLPDTVINDTEFYRAIKLVCGFRGDHEERIWEKIINDRTKFQQFYDVYRSFVRIEIRMGTMYLQKKSYPDEDDVGDLCLLDVVVSEPPSTLHSALRLDAPEAIEKKSVRYAMPVEMEVPFDIDNEEDMIENKRLIRQEQEAPQVAQEEHSKQLDTLEQHEQWKELKMKEVWNLEQLLFDHLKEENMTFEQFMESKDAEQICEFLVDLFKRTDHYQIAQLLETLFRQIRGKSWNQIVEWKRAAEEARSMLQKTREEHKRESDERQQRNETISLFETIDLRHESKWRIGELRARIEKMKMEQEKMVEEGVKEEKLRMEREVREIRKKHSDEKRILESEIKRLTRENANVLTDEDVVKELMEMERKQAETLAKVQAALHKKHADATRILMEEIQRLRLQNERLPNGSQSSHSSRARSFMSSDVITPSPEPEEVLVVDTLIFKMTKKVFDELDFDSLRTDARGILDAYVRNGANRKERKNAEKQFKEFDASLVEIEEMLNENLELLSLGVTQGLLQVPHVPMPFTEKMLQKCQEDQPCCSQTGKAEKEEMGSEEEEELESCPICLDSLSDETMSCWCCRTTYHYECISKWLSINSLCPQCSRTLKDPKTFPSLS